MMAFNHTLTSNISIGSGHAITTVTNWAIVDGGELSALDDGIVNRSTISSGGLVDIASHDHLSFAFGNATVVSSSGVELVGFHGIDTNATINNTGLRADFGGGSAAAATVNFGGVQAGFSGGVTEGTTLKGIGALNATQFVFSGGVANDTVVSGQGIQVVGSGSFFSGGFSQSNTFFISR